MRHRLLALVLAALVPTARAHAQAVASVAARAAVSTTPLAIVATAPLSFGPVVPGVATTVNSKTSANAGEFELRGLRRAEFTATFTLPTVLTVGPYSMPISFGVQSGCQDSNDKGSCKFFDPRVPFTGTINNKAAPENSFYFRIGGTVTPAAAQQPGFYRGTIALQVAYTGN